MTDSSALLANHMAVSDQCLLNLKPSSARGRSYRVSVAPINKSTFNPNDQMIFQLPMGRSGKVLDPTQTYIKYTVVNNDATTQYFNTDNIYYNPPVESTYIKFDYDNKDNDLFLKEQEYGVVQKTWYPNTWIQNIENNEPIYKSRDDNLVLCKYDSISETYSSDHKPVYAVFRVDFVSEKETEPEILKKMNTTNKSQLCIIY